GRGGVGQAPFADYVAAVALDAAAPRILRIAGDSVSARDLAAIMTEVTNARYRTLRVGSLGALGAMIRIARLVSPGENEPFPPWQGMQYMRDQFSGRARLEPLDNSRYRGQAWTSVRSLLDKRFAE
uniref:hypothetical protein n=1 Tax=Brevundimonas sp. TWP2-3-2 TaxID=2804648 RepID=UPI003CEAF00C